MTQQQKPSAKAVDARPRQLKLNPTIRTVQLIAITYLVIVTGVTMLGRWAEVGSIHPNIETVALTLFVVASVIALGATALLESTARER